MDDDDVEPTGQTLQCRTVRVRPALRSYVAPERGDYPPEHFFPSWLQEAFFGPNVATPNCGSDHGTQW